MRKTHFDRPRKLLFPLPTFRPLLRSEVERPYRRGLVVLEQPLANAPRARVREELVHLAGCVAVGQVRGLGSAKLANFANF